MRVLVLFSLHASLLSLFPLLFAKDTLDLGEKIIGNESTLVSSGNKFQMGFFTSNGSSNSSRSYLGIWYYGRKPQTVVWVANRDDPVVVSIGVLEFSKDENLTISDIDGKNYWSSGLPETTLTNKTVLKLKDSGNLVLSGPNQAVLWQSFDYPTDTFLVSMKMNESMELISWKNSNNPRSGNFTFKLQVQIRDRRYIMLRNQNQVYWLSEIIGSLNSEQTIPNTIVDLLTNFTMSNSIYSRSGNSKNPRKEPLLSDYMDTRLVMNSSGVMQEWRWDEKSSTWSVKWFKPADWCDQYNACGNFSNCNINNINRIPCNCLPGFSPRFSDYWYDGDFSAGCERKSAPCGQGTSTRFLDLKMIKVVDPNHHFPVSNEAECRSVCLNNCSQCLAYSYDEDVKSTLGFKNSTCWIWSQDFQN